MKALLDTHALIWWLAGDKLLSDRARQVISDRTNTIVVSAVSAMEVAIKHRTGKPSDVALLAA